MALPDIPIPPDVPSREQDNATFNTNVSAYLIWMAMIAYTLNEWASALPDYIEEVVEDAYAQFDPDGHYTKAQVDAMFAENNSHNFFLAATQ